MKRKNIYAAMLAGVLAAGMALPASAAGGSTANITMNGNGKTYSAYQLMELTTSLKCEDAHEHTDDCYNYAYTVNAQYRAMLQSAAGNAADANKDGSTSDDELIAYIGGLGDSDIRTFADALFEALGSTAADMTSTDKAFNGVAQGYYLIAETELADGTDSRSLVMLNTAGHRNITVNSKEGVPTLKKTILEENDTTGASAWGATADHDIGDKVSFRLTGTLPDNYDNYQAYKYIFHDTLGAGLRLDEASIKVTGSAKGELGAGQFSVRTTSTDGCTFEVEIPDLKDLGIAKGETITVEYNATLLDTAAIGAAGNENKALLEFSNDPYDETKTGKTPEDKVIDFTYKLIVNKVDKKNAPLAGANFELQKLVDGSYATYKTITVTEGQTQFNFVGLDAGKYKLVETKVPAGYNKAADVEFEVVSTMGEGGLTDLQVKDSKDAVISEGEGATFTAAVQPGEMTTNVVNRTGIHLPSTGGAGVYLLYGLGGVALVGGTGLLVVKKKRNNGIED